MAQTLCRICGNAESNETYSAHEKMFGFGDAFEYFRCSGCGCLQIVDPNIDVSRYYPANYYSFGGAGQRNRQAGRLVKWRNHAAVFSGGLVGRLLLALKPHAPLQALGHLDLRQDMRIADVGCGAGDLLHALHGLGFTQLTGIDPNIASDIRVDGSLSIIKANLEQVSGTFDLIMFHHSLEHIPDQSAVLEAARNRLSPGGVCLVRVPVVSSFAWQEYGTDWVQLDAPRHLYLHSTASMATLASRSGFRIDKTIHDSSEFQFWGSEALRRGFTLVDRATGQPNPNATALSGQNRRILRAQAAQLNRDGKGDQAIFILRPMAGT